MENNGYLQLKSHICKNTTSHLEEVKMLNHQDWIFVKCSPELRKAVYLCAAIKCKDNGSWFRERDTREQWIIGFCFLISWQVDIYTLILRVEHEEREQNNRPGTDRSLNYRRQKHERDMWSWTMRGLGAASEWALTMGLSGRWVWVFEHERWWVYWKQVWKLSQEPGE